MTQPNAFLAFSPSDDERHRLSTALSEASPGPPVPGKRVHPENWHVTTRFLGPVDDAVCDRLAAELGSTISVRRGRAVCRGLGAFPKAASAGIVYAAIDDLDGVLEELATVCEEAADSCGLEPEGRRFVPHLTLSRLRPKQDVRNLLAAFGEFRVPLRVDSITLFRTVHSRSGIHYHPLHRIDLATQ